MRKGLYFKIILILVVFILIVMSVVGAVLISNVLGYYTDEFFTCMSENLEGEAQLRTYLETAMESDDALANAEKQRNVLEAYASRLGIDDYRSFYILDSDGNVLVGSDTGNIAFTPN
ncbi:MAG: hypothetical protein IKU61_03875, partial [Clostridia bacterium]|nr:hypothetical protein [Clostridia bacterium]